MEIKRWIRRIAGHVLILGPAAMVVATCMGQDFMPPAGPSNDGRSPGFSAPMNQQPGPGPGFPISPNQQPGFGSPAFWPPPAASGPQSLVPSPSNAIQPGFGPPQPAALLPELPPVMEDPSPRLPEKASNAEVPDDMLGFGGRGGMEGFGGGGGMHPVDSVRYTTLWTPAVPVQGQATDFEMVRQDLSFTHPLWKDSLNALSLTGGVRNERIETDAILPETAQPVPTELWGINMGLRYSRQLDDGWITGGGVSIGSASDHPFAAPHEWNIGMNAMLRIPSGEHNAWLFTLSYSPMGELAFPVPGVAFSWNPSPQFHANIGLPLMIMWRPTDDWQFQASYMLLRTIHIKTQYRFARWLSAFAAYDWSNESYTLLDSPDLNDRFFIYDQRVSLGLQTAFMQHFTASVSGGIIFDRYLFEGTSSTASSADRVYLGNGPFAALNLGARY